MLWQNKIAGDAEIDHYFLEGKQHRTILIVRLQIMRTIQFLGYLVGDQLGS